VKNSFRLYQTHPWLLSFLFVALAAQHVAAQTAPPPLLLGAAWYPEQWPESRWNVDLELMQNANIHVVRVGEFAWSTFEPEEGKYDFDWLERAINLAGQHGIFVVIGTPTAAPPAWLTQKYPETLRVDENGQRAEHGNRQHFNWADPKYREFCRDIAGRMAKRFGHNQYVIGWQIDNEYSQTSADEGTRKQFQDWLKARYGSLGNLNTKWTTVYWSETYSGWSQIPIPKNGGIDSGNPGLLLAWRRFVSETWRSYQKNQIDVIRPNIKPGAFITTNTMGWFKAFDHYTVEQDLDLAAWDDYIPDGHIDPAGNGAAHDLTRGFKEKNFWVMETQPGFVNWAPVNQSIEKDGVRALAWHDIAHGADAVSFWQWRSALNGQEQYHGTLIGADGTPVPLYPEVKQIGEEFARAGSVLANTHVESEVAILHSYESRWAIEWQPQTIEFDPVEELVRYYRPLRELSQSIDIVPPSTSLAKYKLVVAPAMDLLTDAESKNLMDYVTGGGNLVLGPRSVMKDEENSLQTNRQPGPLVPLLGGRVERFYATKKVFPVQGAWGSAEAHIWAELLSVESPDTTVLMRYGKSNGWLDGQPAVITRKVGKGSITYIGMCMDDAGMQHAAKWMIDTAGVQTPLIKVPAGVEASVRYGDKNAVHILVNFSSTPQTITLPAPLDDVLHGGMITTVQLPVYGVAVLNAKR